MYLSDGSLANLFRRVIDSSASYMFSKMTNNATGKSGISKMLLGILREKIVRLVGYG